MAALSTEPDVDKKLAMKLREILPSDAEFDPRHADLDVGGVTADSRAVKRGDVFVAIAGSKADGCASSRRRSPPAPPRSSPNSRRKRRCPSASLSCASRNARRALALIAAKFYPRQPRTIAAVTGTSGKTSVAAFTRQIWTALGSSRRQHRHRSASSRRAARLTAR